MQQIRPYSDITSGLWNSPPLYSKISEITPDDSSFIYSQSPVNDSFTIQLTPIEPPINKEDHSISYRIQKSDPSGNELDLSAYLYQGSNLIASATHTSIPYGYFTTGFDLTNVQATNIFNYSDLRLKFTANTSTYYGLIDEITDLFTDENGYFLTDNVNLDISWVEMGLSLPGERIFSKNTNISYNFDRTDSPVVTVTPTTEIDKQLNYDRPSSPTTPLTSYTTRSPSYFNWPTR